MNGRTHTTPRPWQTSTPVDWKAILAPKSNIVTIWLPKEARRA